MASSVTMQWALAELQRNGSVVLPGAPSGWAKLQRALIWILVVLVPVGALTGTVVGLVVIISGEVDSSVFTFIGMLSVLAMAVGLEVLAVWILKRHRAHTDEARTPVVLARDGLRLREVGPIPWVDFMPARHQMVSNEHDTGWARRAVMELTRSGYFNVNERLAPALRERICPATGPIWNRMHRWIYVPGVEGLGEREVMHLINTAHWMYTQAPQR